MGKIVVLLALLFSVSSAAGAECSDVYLRGGKPSKFDPLAHKALDAHYQITDVDPAVRSYESPKVIAGSMPSAPTGSSGAVLHGYVLLAYVVTRSGRAESPTIVEASDAQLARAAIAATDTWRFNPGKVDGAEVCTVALQEFKF
jgi:TonB family protein